MKVEQYPMGDSDTVPRRVVLVGQKKGGKLKGRLVWTPTRAELSPALQSPEERAQGNTLNARMARLLKNGS